MENKKLRPDEIPVKTAEDLTGREFGKLKVLYRVANNGKTRGAKWRCQCSCQQKTIVDVLASNLKNGHTTSCGCVQKQRVSQVHFNDISGKRFGKLIVLNRAENYVSSTGNTRKVVWNCKCDCGNNVEVEATSLQSRLTQSCGCLGRSKGEYYIKQILEKNNIPFEKQKTFSTCRFLDSNRLAYFDFYINNQYIIEFDGQQHFDIKPHGYFTQDILDDIKRKDLYKNQWCKKNNIPLIRIPYAQLDNLTLQDLLLETSSFIYKGEDKDEQET